ncbi:hypothetical protein [uncultured Sphingomonas sp.]|uniref:hypothetical protein n=1 Tax=uncultured Sphingomonas sp. TaxID=158754 RepID=UPI0025EB6280|nr:hypothetical protein [uncultured Sphingomonas sp.]
MIEGLTTALLAGAAAVAGVSTDIGHSHSVRIDHHRGAIDADYRSRVLITHKQIGSVAPGRVPSTLRCQWQANLVVDRDARHAGGTMMARTMMRDAALTGSRPGWCEGAKRAIAQEVAARESVLRDHLVAMAADDHAVLTAEVERLHDPVRRG